jgi:transcription elongation GreA/GreB family factor
MSRAFVKEPDGDMAVDDQLDLPQSPHPNYVTPAGLKALEARLAELEGRRQQVSVSDDLADKLPLAQVDRDIRYLEGRIERAIPVDAADQPADEVCFGAIVGVAGETGSVVEYAIVGEDEADAGRSKVSWVSPLAQALQGARVGDVITWKRPSGDVELEVVSIRHPGD